MTGIRFLMQYGFFMAVCGAKIGIEFTYWATWPFCFFITITSVTSTYPMTQNHSRESLCVCVCEREKERETRFAVTSCIFSSVNWKVPVIISLNRDWDVCLRFRGICCSSFERQLQSHSHCLSSTGAFSDNRLFFLVTYNQSDRAAWDMEWGYNTVTMHAFLKVSIKTFSIL